MRSRQIAFNAESVDVTDAESSGRWRELLAGAGVKRASVSGSGIFKDASTDATIRQVFFDGTIRDWQVIVPDFGTLQGPFQVTALEYSGEHDGELAYEIALEVGRRHRLHGGLTMVNRHRGEIEAELDGRRVHALPDARRAGRARGGARGRAT